MKGLVVPSKRRGGPQDATAKLIQPLSLSATPDNAALLLVDGGCSGLLQCDPVSLSCRKLSGCEELDALYPLRAAVTSKQDGVGGALVAIVCDRDGDLFSVDLTLSAPFPASAASLSKAKRETESASELQAASMRSLATSGAEKVSGVTAAEGWGFVGTASGLFAIDLSNDRQYTMKCQCYALHVADASPVANWAAMNESISPVTALAAVPLAALHAGVQDLLGFQELSEPKSVVLFAATPRGIWAIAVTLPAPSASSSSIDCVAVQLLPLTQPRVVSHITVNPSDDILYFTDQRAGTICAVDLCWRNSAGCCEAMDVQPVNSSGRRVKFGNAAPIVSLAGTSTVVLADGARLVAIEMTTTFPTPLDRRSPAVGPLPVLKLPFGGFGSDSETLDPAHLSRITIMSQSFASPDDDRSRSVGSDVTTTLPHESQLMSIGRIDGSLCEDDPVSTLAVTLNDMNAAISTAMHQLEAVRAQLRRETATNEDLHQQLAETRAVHDSVSRDHAQLVNKLTLDHEAARVVCAEMSETHASHLKSLGQHFDRMTSRFNAVLDKFSHSFAAISAKLAANASKHGAEIAAKTAELLACKPDFQRAIADLSAELDSAQHQLRQASLNATEASEREARALAECDALRQSLSNLQASHSDTSDLLAHALQVVQAKESEISGLTAKFGAAVERGCALDVRVRELSASLAIAEANTRELFDKMTEQEGELEVSRMRIEELQSKIVALEADGAAATERKEMLEQELGATAAALERLTNDHDRLRLQLLESKSKCESLQCEIELFRSSSDDTVASQRDQIAALQRDLEVNVTALRELRDDRTAAFAELNELRAVVDVEPLVAASLASVAADLRAAVSQQLSDAQSRLQSSIVTSASTAARLNEVTAELLQAKQAYDDTIATKSTLEARASQLTNLLAASESDVEMMVAEVEALQRALHCAHQEKGEIEGNLVALDEDRRTLLTENQSMLARERELQLQLARSRSTIDDLQSRLSAVTVDLEVGRGDVAGLVADKTALQAAIDASDARVGELELIVGDLELRVDRLESELAATRADLDRVTVERDGSREECELLTQELTTTHSQLKEAQVTIGQLRRAEYDLTVTMASLQCEVTSVTAAKQTVDASLASCLADVDALNGDRLELLRESETLLSAVCLERDAAVANAEALAKRVDELTHLLEGSQQRIEALDRDVVTLRADRDAQEVQHRETLAAVHDRHNAEVAAANDAMTAVTGELERVTTESIVAARQLKDAESALEMNRMETASLRVKHAIQVSYLQSAVHRAQSQVASVMRAHRDEGQQLQTEHELMLSTERTAKTDARSEVSALLDKVARLQAEMERRSGESAGAIDGLRRECDGLKVELDRERTEHDETRQQLAEASGEVGNLRQELCESKSEVEAAVQRITILEVANATLADQLDVVTSSLSRKVLRAQQECAAYQAEVGEKTAQADQLTRLLDSSTAHCERITAEFEDHKRASTQKLTENDCRIQSLSARVSALEATNAKLTSELSSTRALSESLTFQLTAVREAAALEIAALQDSEANLKRRLHDTESYADRLNEQCSDLATTVEVAHERLNDLVVITKAQGVGAQPLTPQRQLPSPSQQHVTDFHVSTQQAWSVARSRAVLNDKCDALQAVLKAHGEHMRRQTEVIQHLETVNDTLKESAARHSAWKSGFLAKLHGSSDAASASEPSLPVVVCSYSHSEAAVYGNLEGAMAMLREANTRLAAMQSAVQDIAVSKQ